MTRPMTRSETLRCWFYGLVALGALIGTQWSLVAFLVSEDNGGLGGALEDIVAGPAATFVTLDLLAIAVAVTAFMVIEGRRLKLPRLWLYVVLVFTVAVSVAFPLFLIERTRLLAGQRAADAG